MPNDQKLTKDQRKSEAREKLRLARETAAKKKKRNSLLLKIGIIVGVLAVIAVAVFAVMNTNSKNDYSAINQPKNMMEQSIVVGDGQKVVTEIPEDTARVTIFQDYHCPACKQFEESLGSEIDRMIDDGVAVVDYRVVTFLDSQSLGTNYSSRAANAAYCVANEYPEHFYNFNKLMYANQPAEGTEGLKNAELIALADSTNAENLDSCIKDGTFRGFAKKSNEDSLKLGIEGTPTIKINGEVWNKEGSLYDAAKTAGSAKNAEPAVEGK
ncbi:MAG: thioredoxin domain-containing protein [Enterococcus sp.]|nr:thioredoxin domain-containing protein [Enterococcus sp.]